MVQREKVCRACKRFVQGSTCPICNQSNFSRSWKGLAVITDPDSEIAKQLNVTVPGRYCLWVR